MAELEVGNLQLGVDAVDHGVVLAPVELEGLAGCKGQRAQRCSCAAVRLASCCSCRQCAGKGSHPVVGTGVAQLHQVAVQLLDGLAAACGAAGTRGTASWSGSAHSRPAWMGLLRLG